MSRRIQIYVSSEIFGACRLIAKSRSDDMHKTTVEDIIEWFVTERISAKYPKIFEHMKQIDKLEKELLKTL